ncbi:MAG: hypothetical protein HGB17_14705 [Syntrophobacteraceae bacterium]|nr:hypothetical protein [Syntrophobacteraceae bacterium]
MNNRVFDLYVLTLMAVLSAVFYLKGEPQVGANMGSATIGACAMYLRQETAVTKPMETKKKEKAS